MNTTIWFWLGLVGVQLKLAVGAVVQAAYQGVTPVAASHPVSTVWFKKFGQRNEAPALRWFGLGTDGTMPVSSLSLATNAVRLVRSPSGGMEPVRPFAWTLKTCRFVKPARVGIGPVSLLASTLKYQRFTSPPRKGMDPVRRLSWASNTARAVRPSSDGITPSR